MKLKTVLFLACILLANPLPAATLDLTIDGFKNNTGQVLIYLYDKPGPFPVGFDKSIASWTIKIKNKQAMTKLENIEDGLYALAVIHDENGDGKLERNFIGVPKEGVAASNNVRGNVGPPSFEKASFKLKNHARLSITVHY